MKYVPTILLLLLPALITIPVFSQSAGEKITTLLTAPQDTITDDYSLLFLCRKDRVDIKAGKHIEPPSWKDGLLLDWNNQVLKIRGRYRPDVRGIQLLLKSEAVWLDSEKFKGARLGEKIYLTATTEKGEPDAETTVFSILEDGRAVLLKQEAAKKKPCYFVYRYGESAQRFKGKKKKLLAFLNDRRLEIEHYLRKNDPHLKDEEGMRAVFRYYNQLN